MKKQYTNLDELLADLRKEVENSLKTDVTQKTIELEKEHIKSDVYAKYEPTQYSRRKEIGGLLDTENFQVEDLGDGVEITNITEDDESGKWIVPTIEYGTGYEWEKSRIYKMQPYPRPFVENTKNDLENGKLKEYMRESLEKKGIKTEG
jgi:hypothetical protein